MTKVKKFELKFIDHINHKKLIVEIDVRSTKIMEWNDNDENGYLEWLVQHGRNELALKRNIINFVKQVHLSGAEHGRFEEYKLAKIKSKKESDMVVMSQTDNATANTASVNAASANRSAATNAVAAANAASANTASANRTAAVNINAAALGTQTNTAMTEPIIVREVKSMEFKMMKFTRGQKPANWKNVFDYSVRHMHYEFVMAGDDFSETIQLTELARFEIPQEKTSAADMNNRSRNNNAMNLTNQPNVTNTNNSATRNQTGALANQNTANNNNNTRNTNQSNTMSTNNSVSRNQFSAQSNHQNTGNNNSNNNNSTRNTNQSNTMSANNRTNASATNKSMNSQGTRNNQSATNSTNANKNFNTAANNTNLIDQLGGDMDDINDDDYEKYMKYKKKYVELKNQKKNK